MRLLTATLTAPDSESEAEPVLLSIEDALTLTLDDGTELAFDLEEFMRAVDGEQAPSESEAA